METVLLTGVAGFIGHRTCELLLEQGYTVVGLDNLNDYYDLKLKKYRLASISDNPNFNFYEVDIENKKDLESIFTKYKFKTIFNLAARAGVRYSLVNPDVYVSTNIQGGLNLLELARRFGVTKYILASTSSLYAGKEMPFVEALNVNEPLSPYAATKKAAESMAYSYHHLYNIDVSILRYFTVYGPLSRPDMAQMRFMRWIDDASEIQLYGDGEQSRDFTHVDDIARGTILAQKKLGYEVINLGGGNNPISVNRMIQILASELDKKAIVKHFPFNKADMVTTWANIQKAKDLLHWSPTIDLETGLKSCVDHYLENKNFYQSIELG
ncbi:MAG: NAD-dependent epimerase/dehydratase family protein [Halobacteriovoraceae bacterium]|jgi:UDP-glucuronate 4-epimerase|nr:NAD-dependent epimerase/dehydratase family protein [Halobacteriovoraceae bacterium]